MPILKRSLQSTVVVGSVVFLLVAGAVFALVQYSFSAGEKAIKQGDYLKAERYFLRVTRLAPWSGKYQAFLAYSFQRQSKLDLAIETYNRAIALKYAPSTVWLNRGYVYRAKAFALQNRGDTSSSKSLARLAVKDLEKATRINPQSAQSYFYLGNVQYYLLQDYAKALEFYKKAFELEPGNWRHLTGIAAGYAGTGDYQKSLFYLEESIRIKPTPQAYNSIGWVYGYRLQDPERAIQAFEQAILINPHYALAYENLAGIYQRLGNKEKAITLYEKYLELDPNGFRSQSARDQLEKLKAK